MQFTTDGLPRDGVLRLRDGRALPYREWDDQVGAPVVFAHGTPASRVWCPDPHQDVRLITVDRPGIGGSDVQLGLTVDGWAALAWVARENESPRIVTGNQEAEMPVHGVTGEDECVRLVERLA